MKVFAFPVTITLTVYAPGVNGRDAQNRLEADDVQWMEPVTQGDCAVHVGPPIETSETT